MGGKWRGRVWRGEWREGGSRGKVKERAGTMFRKEKKKLGQVQSSQVGFGQVKNWKIITLLAPSLFQATLYTALVWCSYLVNSFPAQDEEIVGTDGLRGDKCGG